MENLSSAGKIPRVTGGMLSAGKYQPRSQVTFSFFLENVYREPRDQPQPGSFGCFLEGGREFAGKRGRLCQYQEKLHTKVTDVTASHKKK